MSWLKTRFFEIAGHSATRWIRRAARKLQPRLGRLQKWLRRSRKGVLDGKWKHLHADKQRGLRAENRARRLRRQQEVNINEIQPFCLMVFYDLASRDLIFWHSTRFFSPRLNYRYAQYSHFKIHSEADYYKLEIDGYEGNAGDSLNDPWYGSNNSPFSTYNRDNDRSSLNCASMLKVCLVFEARQGRSTSDNES